MSTLLTEALIFAPVLLFVPLWAFVWWTGRRHLDPEKIRLPDVDL